jgi:ribosomal protein L11 methyltransferase
MKVVMNDLESKILGVIDEASAKMNFGRIKKCLYESQTFSDRQLKQAIANLVASGTLAYTFHFGRSFIERSLEKPLQISEHVVLKPPRCSADMTENCVVISIEKGAAFGCGDHPTTRMAIELIDQCLHHPYWQTVKPSLKAIDIGTGSGILSIVAAKLGLGSVIGVDIDPCSLHEARENVTLNQLNDRIQIHAKSIDQLNETFDLVFANLRTPTLISLCHAIDKKLNKKCALIFSGMKAEESLDVCEPYQQLGFSTVEIRQKKGWGAICLTRGLFLSWSEGDMV